MHLNLFGKLAGGVILALGLSGCVDVDVDVALTSASTARATMTQTMGAEIYAMAKTSADEAGNGEPGFCDEGDLVENADGSATCSIVEEGPFADLDLGQDEGGMRFAEAGPGLVRMALPTADMTAEMGIEDDMDAETRQMVTAFFEGHDITISFSGAEVVETNMSRAADGRSASQVIPMLDLINGTLDLPEELYAVVRAP